MGGSIDRRSSSGVVGQIRVCMMITAIYVSAQRSLWKPYSKKKKTYSIQAIQSVTLQISTSLATAIGNLYLWTAGSNLITSMSGNRVQLPYTEH
ncbi:hypothetical protein BDN67DRAFT_681904 [Paxillus ammoniavirescens]|nr:hypothetical protein BDN67DRAFT_681904 [Paxillus ammoniavirescens]